MSGFMHPGFAIAGLVALLVPVWVHLYQRRASKKVPISSLRLVPEMPRVTRQRKCLQHWAVFCARAAGVILLGLAFARPGWSEGEEPSRNRREALVLILDRTASMQSRLEESGTSWEEAVEIAREQVEALSAQSRVLLLPVPAAESDGDADDWQKPTEVLKRLSDLTPSYEAGAIEPALASAAEALARFRTDMPKALTLVSDLQQADEWGMERLSFPEELRVRVFQAGPREVRNAGLALAIRGADQLRTAVVDSNDVVAKLSVSERSWPEGDPVSRELTLPDRVVEMACRAAHTGWVERVVRAGDHADALAVDDAVHQVYYVPPAIPVWLVEPHPERQVFLQETFFLAQALKPAEGEGAQDSRFAPRVIPATELVAALAQNTRRDVVVVLPTLDTWPAGLGPALTQLVSEGGGLVCYAGEAWGAMQDGLGELSPVQAGGVVPLDRALALPPISEDHPLWGGLSEGLRQILRRVPLRQRLRARERPGAQVIARYADSLPLVVSQPVGAGRVLFVNTTMDRRWGEWPTEGRIFVPTVHMLMSAAITTEERTFRNSVSDGVAGRPLRLYVGKAFAGTAVGVESVRGTVEADGWVALEGLREPGVFEVRTATGEGIRPVAINVPREEREVARGDAGVVRRQLEGARKVASADDPVRIAMAGEASSWWQLLLIAGLLVWILEPWLVLRTIAGQQKRGTET